jgi:tetratricopeptide (TPR) repeat protein
MTFPPLKKSIPWGLLFLIYGLLCVSATAEKVLVYDEERGIVFVERDSLNRPKKEVHTAAPAIPQPSTNPADLHVNRKKDPPDIYFRSGLEYFKARDYQNALKNFEYAHSLQNKALYRLWIGKTFRQLNQNEKMLQVMNSILKKHPNSDVADDALFEIAFYHQVHNDYHQATRYYNRLAEQYPFGTSYSNGEEFRDLAREQTRVMRAEIVAALNLLGFSGEELPQLYTEYQQQRGIKPSGVGDKATVSLIKADRQAVEDAQSQMYQQIAQTRQQRTIALICAGICAVLLLLLLSLQITLRKKKRVLQTLSDTLSELDFQRNNG